MTRKSITGRLVNPRTFRLPPKIGNHGSMEDQWKDSRSLNDVKETCSNLPLAYLGRPKRLYAYLDDPDENIQAGLRYKIHCIERDIPYLGFFDRVYSAARPFALPHSRA